jgi:hypothetical protein
VDAVASRCVEAWLNSPPHRHNLLSPEYNRMGLGVATTGDTYLITQNFGYEAIEIETLESTRNDKGGFDVSLTFTVVDGTHNGDIFYEGASVAKWSAESGLAAVDLTLRGPGILQIGQVKADGTPKESVSCEVPVWTEPTHYALSEMPLLSH